MPTNEERREVAARLRAIDDTEWTNGRDELLALDNALGVAYGMAHAHQTTWERFADLIEPEERTCRMELNWDYDGDCPAYYRDYVCSECEEDFIYYKNSRISYCPNCGAKVVR